jgi:SAM-dependent methyltransferase
MSAPRETDFDHWSGSYAETIEKTVPFLPEGHDFYVRTKAEEVLEMVEARLGPPAGVRAVDVGCGLGLLHPHLVGRLASLEAADIAEATLERARRANPGVGYRLYEGATLPFDDGGAHVAFAMGVVHHVDPAAWPAFLAELVRVTRPGGLVAFVEPNLMNPVCRLGASRCEFDQDANFLSPRALRRLAEGAGLRDVEVRYILFVPFRAPGRRALERRLRWLPLGAQFILSGRVIA